jgi:hypothetical protein
VAAKPAKPKPKPPTTAQRIVTEARSLLGIHEIPDGSNQGPDVHRIQSATGAYGLPWCVSTVQYIVKQVTGHTIADGTAGVYYLIDYAGRHDWTVPHAVVGGPVCYRIGQGHAGTVVTVHSDGTFDAVEGNEANAVRLMHRDPRTLSCVFLKPPYLT